MKFLCINNKQHRLTLIQVFFCLLLLVVAQTRLVAQVTDIVNSSMVDLMTYTLKDSNNSVIIRTYNIPHGIIGQKVYGIRDAEEYLLNGNPLLFEKTLYEYNDRVQLYEEVIRTVIYSSDVSPERYQNIIRSLGLDKVENVNKYVGKLNKLLSVAKDVSSPGANWNEFVANAPTNDIAKFRSSVATAHNGLTILGGVLDVISIVENINELGAYSLMAMGLDMEFALLIIEDMKSIPVYDPAYQHALSNIETEIVANATSERFNSSLRSS